MYADAAEYVDRLRLPCFAHIASTSTGRGIASVQRDFSGFIAASLAMDAGGKVKDFRAAIEGVLLEESELEILDAPRLPADHESVRYLRDVLHLCLPSSGVGSERAGVLMSLLSSDVREPRVQLRVPGITGNE